MALFIWKLALTLLSLGVAGMVGLMVAEESFKVEVKPCWKYPLGLILAGGSLVILLGLAALWMA
jgi:hypothetical protein